MTIALSGEAEITDGMRITIDPSKLHFFDAETGKRLEASVPAKAPAAVAEPVA
ncbi:hypothetical protein D3C86_2048120 [compost metagenome]